MKIDELLDLDLLGEMIDQGYVGMQAHRTEPLFIYNYTHKAQYDRVWNSVTRQCRGLIVRHGAFGPCEGEGDVVARPWPKFFNYGEYEEGILDLDAEVTARDKLDGSLGILYPTSGGHAIATRGSFASEQAIKGTEILHGMMRFNPGFTPLPGVTYLFEILYPENRIVLDYGDKEALVLLGIVDNETGATDHGDIIWPGEFASFLHARTLREALELSPRENAEGIVVRFKDTHEMLKIKQDDYVALHRIVTGLNERVVWSRLGAGESVREICTGLPDEFVAWTEGVAARLIEEAARIEAEARRLYGCLLVSVSLEFGPEYTRGDLASIAKRRPEWSSYMFSLLDGKDIKEAIWRTLKPEGKAPRVFSEATA